MTGPPAGWTLPVPAADTAGLIVTEAWEMAQKAAEAALGIVRAAADAEYATALQALENLQAAEREQVRTGVYASWGPQFAKAQTVIDRAARLRAAALAVVGRWQAGAGPGDLGPWYDAVDQLQAMAAGDG